MLELHTNGLEGGVPSSLGRCTAMKRCSLHNNKLTGSVPPELGDWPALEWLYVDNGPLGTERATRKVACGEGGIGLQ